MESEKFSDLRAQIDEVKALLPRFNRKDQQATRLRVGELLASLKEQVAHGDWSQLCKSIGISPRTAINYISFHERGGKSKPKEPKQKPKPAVFIDDKALAEDEAPMVVSAGGAATFATRMLTGYTGAHSDVVCEVVEAAAQAWAQLAAELRRRQVIDAPVETPTPTELDPDAKIERVDGKTNDPDEAPVHAVGSFVYRKGTRFSDGQLIDEWTPHRVLRITSKRVFIERGESTRDWIRSKMGQKVAATTVLNRAELERTGRTYQISGADGFVFYHACIPVNPAVTATLGLKWPCTVTDIKAAYHAKARETHPDLGGDADRFRAVQAAYEQAMRMAGGAS